MTRADVTSRIEAAERAYQSADRIYQKAREDRRARMTELQTLRAAAAVELDRARVAKWADPAIDAQLAEADETVRLAGSELRRVRHELGVEYAAKVRADNATIRREYGAAKASVIPSLGADDIGSRVVEDPRYLMAQEMVTVARGRRNALRRQRERSAALREYQATSKARDERRHGPLSPLLQRLGMTPRTVRSETVERIT